MGFLTLFNPFCTATLWLLSHRINQNHRFKYLATK
jgi:hypothetical protein